MPQLDRDVDAALSKLYAGTPSARSLEKHAKAILVFPSVVKAGFLFGAQYGDGALRRRGKTVGYYNTVAASYGYQAGLQSFGYVLFFMSDAALRYLDDSGGFELCIGPGVRVLRRGKARSRTTTTMPGEVYAVIFHEKGLMAAVGTH